MMTQRVVRLAALMALSVPVMLSAAACEKDFSGPYPCIKGFASCLNPNSNQCETNVENDPQHCGDCENPCPQGAVCVEGSCGVAPRKLATDVYPSSLTENTSSLYWGTNSGVAGVTKTGGAPITIDIPSAIRGGGNTLPFAVDDVNVYYLGNMPVFNGPSQLDIEAVPSSGASQTPRVINQNPLDNANQGVSNIQLAGGSLIISGSSGTGGSNALSVVQGPKVGGVFSLIQTFTNVNGMLTVDSANAYVMSNCDLYRGSLSGGGTPTKVASMGQSGCPALLVADGTDVFWATSQFFYDNENRRSQCSLHVGKVPVTGGIPKEIGSVAADEAPFDLAVDGSSVYVATNQSVWKVPIAGGAPVRVAGNLGAATGSGSGPSGGNQNGSGCTYITSFNQMSPVGLVIDASHIYVAVSTISGQPGDLLEIPNPP